MKVVWFCVAGDKIQQILIMGEHFNNKQISIQNEITTFNEMMELRRYEYQNQLEIYNIELLYNTGNIELLENYRQLLWELGDESVKDSEVNPFGR